LGDEIKAIIVKHIISKEKSAYGHVHMYIYIKPITCRQRVLLSKHALGGLII